MGKAALGTELTAPPALAGYYQIYSVGNELFGIAPDGTITNLTQTAIPNTFKLTNVITVDPQGSEVAGERYTSLEDAVSFCNNSATSVENYVILLSKNITVTSAISITNEFFTIAGLGQFATTINVDDDLAGSAVITIDLGDASPIPSWNPLANLRIVGSALLESTSGTQVIDFRSNGVAYIQNIRIDNFNIGFNLDNDFTGQQFVVLTGETVLRDCTKGIVAGDTDVELNNCVFTECELAIELNSTSEFTLRAGLITGAPTEVGVNTGIENNSTGNIILRNLDLKDLNIGVILNSTGATSFDKCNFQDNVTTHAIINAAAIIETLSTQLDLSKVNFVVPPANILGTFLNNQAGDAAFNVYKELAVGSPQQGYEFIAGEGDSYTVSALYYEFNGSVFSNVKDDLINKGDGNTWAFPGLTAGNALYLSNQFSKTFPGFKAALTTSATLSTGDIVFEYWDGSAWTEFNHMITEAGDTYLPFANDKFEVGTTDYQIRFDPRIIDDWALSDPVGLGSTHYWCRLRISNTIITSPVFDQIKIHTNRFEANADGFNEFFGTAREVRKFPINYGNLAAAGSSPANVDIFLSDTLFAGRNENDFQDGVTDRSGLAQTLPFDLDTSSPLKVHVTFMTESDTTGDIEFSVKWNTLSVGGDIYDATAAAPTTSPGEQEIVRNITIPVNSSDTKLSEFFELDIPEAIAQKFVGGQVVQGDTLFITLTRTGGTDSFGGDMRIIDLAIYYTAWRGGGHLKAEIV